MTAPDNSDESAREVPEALAGAIKNAVGARPNPSAEQLLAAIDPLLEKVLRTNCDSRSSALDLLTVDALMTKAMELGGEDPDLMQRLHDIAFRMIAAHASVDSRSQ